MEVSNTWRELLEDIKKQESGNLGLHMNPTELDITTAYGIYKYAHKNAEVFKYIDEVAKSLGFKNPSNTWKDRATLATIQANIDPEKELYLTYLFYKDYFEVIKLSIFPDEIKRYIASLYTNSPKLCAKALQMTCNQFIYYNFKYGKGYYKRTQVVKGKEEPWYLSQDGILGKQSWEVINNIMDLLNKEPEYIKDFKYLLCNYAKTYYTMLVSVNHSNVVYSKGWNNRIDNLLN